MWSVIFFVTAVFGLLLSAVAIVLVAIHVATDLIQLHGHGPVLIGAVVGLFVFGLMAVLSGASIAG